MGRPIRIQFPGAFYHIWSRGNSKQDIYLNDGDRDRFLHFLSIAVTRYQWILHGYCLMDNHYHLLLETPEPNLSNGMRYLNGQYAQKFNFNNGRCGHVFEKRFDAYVVERDEYLFELTRYITLNPVRARMVKHPADYPWSSFRAATGRCPTPAFLSIETTLGLFSHDIVEAMRKYDEHVLDGIGREIQFKIRAGALLGTDAFCERLEKEFLGEATKKAIPSDQKHAFRPALAQLFSLPMGRHERNERIYIACRQYGYRQKEIADYLELAYSTTNEIVKKMDLQTLKDLEK